MDIQKEEKFEALPEIEMMLRENPDIKFENGGYVYHGLNQLTALAVCYVAGAWMAWKEAKAQAVPEWKEYEKESPRIDGRYQILINGEQLTANWETPFGFSSAEDNTAFLQHLITHWSMLPENPKEAL